MIFPDQAVRIVIATKPVDFRKGHDGLASMAHSELGFAPKAGVMVVFRSKRGDRIKVLFWDGSGIVMIYKRLEQGGFAWPKVGGGSTRVQTRWRATITFCEAAGSIVRSASACRNLTAAFAAALWKKRGGCLFSSVFDRIARD